MKKNLCVYITIMACWMLGSCKKADSLNVPLNKSEGKPDVVYGVTVKNDSARATITYTLPKNKDLSYVKAVYKLADSSIREIKASLYSNSLVVDGFGDTLVHNVQLYAFNKAEVASDPVVVAVKPLENPIWGVLRSMKISPDFAGIRVLASNPSRYNVAIEIYKDSLHSWIQYSGIYTSTTDINSAVRGMDTIPQKLAILVRDRFLNRTDTLFTTLTPYYETFIPKSWYKEYALPGDAVPAWTANRLSNLWDGDIINWPNVLITKDEGVPAVLTFDIGKLAKLSRLVTWDYPEYLNSGRTYFYAGNPRFFEIWGSDSPPLDGSWANWKKLASCTEVKPSGLPYGTNSSEDYAKGYAGFNWDLDPTAGPVRYLRIKCLQNWSGSYYLGLSELLVYGDPR